MIAARSATPSQFVETSPGTRATHISRTVSIAARRFAGPLPFTFTYNKNTQEVLIIEGVRENWIPVPVNVINHQVSFIHALGLKGVVLANAFLIKNIPYQWKKGKIEIWKK